jgi:hypothetical protein
MISKTGENLQRCQTVTAKMTKVFQVIAERRFCDFIFRIAVPSGASLRLARNRWSQTGATFGRGLNGVSKYAG